MVAEQTRADRIKFPADLLARRNVVETDLAIKDQERQFRERRQTLDGQIGILSAQIEQKQQDIAGRQRQKESLAAQMASYKAEMTSVFPLVQKATTPATNISRWNAMRRGCRAILVLPRVTSPASPRALMKRKLQIKQTRFKFDEDALERAERCPRQDVGRAGEDRDRRGRPDAS